MITISLAFGLAATLAASPTQVVTSGHTTLSIDALPALRDAAQLQTIPPRILTNILQNPGFETGSLPPWTTNNWSITTTDPHTGLWSGEDIGNFWISYCFSPVPVANITSITFWSKQPDVQIQAVDFFYSPVDYDEFIVWPQATWTFHTVTGWLRAVGSLETFRVWGYVGGGPAIDLTLVDDFIIDTTIPVTSCNPIGSCGDGVTDPGEQCDDGAANSNTTPDSCRLDCTLPRCGDGVGDTGELCDNGTGNSDTQPDACRIDCTLPRCGDGVDDTIDQCDDGNSNPTDLCDANCLLTRCGDAILQSPNGQGTGGPTNNGNEACDDGNIDPADLCAANCVLTRCGDGIAQAPNGQGTGGPTNNGTEACDDGNTSSADLCTATCTLTRCGDGILQAPNGQGTGGPGNNGVEQCDDGNPVPNDGCTNCRTDPILSVTWLSIDATCSEGSMHLTWQIAEEHLSYGYVVKHGRSQQGPFSAVGSPVWATGSYSRYEFVDPAPMATQPWYMIEEQCSDPIGCSSSPAVRVDCIRGSSTGGRKRTEAGARQR